MSLALGRPTDVTAPVAVVPASPEALPDDRRFWPQLAAADAARFGAAWLGLQRHWIEGLSSALLLLRTGSTTLEPVASVAGEGPHAASLQRAAEAALAKGAGVARREADGLIAAYPLMLDGAVAAVAAVRVEGASEPEAVLRGLRWGAGWLRAWLIDRARADDQPSLERARTGFGLLAGALQEAGFAAAARQTVTKLAQLAACDRVSVGFWRRGHTQVAAISHTAQFGRRMDLVRQVAACMDEAIEQQATIMVPTVASAPPHVAREHLRFQHAAGGGQVLTIPFFAQDRFQGAFCFERRGDRPFDQATVDLLDAAVHLAGPLLEERRRADQWLWRTALDATTANLRRLFGAGHLKVKLVAVAFAGLAALFSQLTTTYEIAAEAVLEGSIQRSLVAPFDGFVSSTEVRAGDVVEAGAVLARLDDRDLLLERLRWWTERQRYQLDYERALAERDRARLNVVQAQIEQAEARVELLDVQLARAEIRAPFAGIVVAGDLSQAIGGAVARGDTLFQLAPLDSYRVTLWVDERQIDDVANAAAGKLRLAALPTEPFSIRVQKVTPVAEVRDGRNAFRVEAELEEATARLRPGMNGVARIEAGERLLIWTWTRTLLDWSRLWWWRLVG
ncbi:MAG: HlyD family efflux transporter periplasmic adaptor subunit [Geminicoccaceae bacterium]|nr:MAG: HlyD family efflux transporter periplasmic adaptor subunit [Geminicoccaceae bacterium]